MMKDFKKADSYKKTQSRESRRALIKQFDVSSSCVIRENTNNTTTSYPLNEIPKDKILSEDDKSKNSCDTGDSDSLNSFINTFTDTLDEEDTTTWYTKEYFQKSDSFKMGSQEINQTRTALKSQAALTDFLRNPPVFIKNRYSFKYQRFQGCLGLINDAFLNLFASISKLDNTRYMILFGLLTAGLGIHEWFLSFMLENRGRFKTLLLTLRNFLISYISPKMWDEPASVLKKLFLSGFKLVSSAGFPDVIKLFNDKLLSQSLNSRSTTIYYVILPGVTIIVGVAFIFFINKPIIMPIISKFLARQAFVVVKEKFKDFTKASQRSFITFLKDMFKSMPDKIDNN